MPYSIPTTNEIAERNIAHFERCLAQNVPLCEKSFLRVLAVMEAMSTRQLYAFAQDNIRNSFAISASDEGLNIMGQNYGIIRKEACAWEGKIQFGMQEGSILSIGTVFTFQNIRYQVTENEVAPSSKIVIANIVCLVTGTIGNLNEGDNLTILTPIRGADRQAEVIQTVRYGISAETTENYRRRILEYIRHGGDGGSMSDYRRWAQDVEGVKRAYPYTGCPIEDNRESLPGERTVYIESISELNPDGIPPQNLLDNVRVALLQDPKTGISRELLGLPDYLLYVRPIVRTKIYIWIGNMQILYGNREEIKMNIENSLKRLIEGIEPFIQGLDTDFDKRNMVTASIIGSEVQAELDPYGGHAEGISFGFTMGSARGSYYLKPNEKLVLDGVLFEGE